MSSIRIAMAGVALCALMAGPARAGSPLDGKSYAIKVKEPGKKKAGPDKLIFAGGKLTSTDCTKYGFKATAYKAKKSGSGWSFTAAPKSAKEGQVFWSGKVEGKKVSGTMKWVKKGQKTINYTFSGALALK